MSIETTCPVCGRFVKAVKMNEGYRICAHRSSIDLETEHGDCRGSFKSVAGPAEIKKDVYVQNIKHEQNGSN